MSTSLYSNQNRENQYNPYFTTLGNTVLYRNGADQTIAPNAGVTVIWDTVNTTLTVPNTGFTVNVGNGQIIFNSPGVYNINATAVVTDASAPTSNNVNCKSSLTNSASGAIYNNGTFYGVAGATGATQYIISRNVTSYFQAGDIISMGITNNSPSNTNLLIKGGNSGTQVVISHIL